MSDTPLLDRIYGQEKTAALPGLVPMLQAVGQATGLHVGQNALLKGMISRPGFGKFLGGSFQRGVSGAPMSKGTSFLGGLLGGTVLPEAHAMSTQAHQIGGAVNRALRTRGVKELTPRDMVIARAISEGKFSKILQNPRYHMTPAFNSMMQIAEKQSGLPVRSYLSKALYSKNATEKAQALGTLKQLEGVWQDPNKSPFTANILSNLTRGGKTGHLGPIPINAPGSNTGANIAHLAGTAIGAGGVGMVDPAIGVLNAAKGAATNPAARSLINKTSLGQKALGWFENKFVKQPVGERFVNSFVHGHSPEVPPARHMLNTYGKNALADSMAQSAGQLGAVAGQAIPKPARQLMSDKIFKKGPV